MRIGLRHLLCGIGLAASVGLAPAISPAQTPPRADQRAQAYTFAFRDADAAQVVEEVIGRGLGLSYTLDPAVTAKITFRVDLETTLATYNIVLVRNGESLLVTTRANARSGLRKGAGAGAAGYRTETVPVINAQPSEIAAALHTMGAGDVVAFTDDKAGILMLGGTPDEIAAARETIATLDQRLAPKSRWIDLKNVSADVVARELTDLVVAMKLTDVHVAAIPRLRGLMIFASNDENLNQAADFVTRLDTTSAEGDGTLWSYRPRNVGADSLSATLNEVLGNGVSPAPLAPTTSTSSDRPSPTGSSAPSVTSTSGRSTSSSPSASPSTAGGAVNAKSAAGGGDIRIAVDQESNTLVISSPPDRRPEIQRLLTQLDVRPKQVLIEARVLEVTLGDEFRFGVDWSVLSSDGSTLIKSTSDAAGAIRPTYPGIAVTFVGGNVNAAIDALGSRTHVTVISSPKVIVLDNRSARLQIGDQVPVAKQTSQSALTADAPTLVSIEYRDTGVLLDVTPRVTGENDVTLLVSQQVSAVAKTTTSGIDSPTIEQRQFDSSLLLNSGGTVALGGLISTTHSSGRSGVPGFSELPLIGGLFRTDTQSNQRTELIVLLSATILPDPAASTAATQDLVGKMKGLEGSVRAPE